MTVAVAKADDTAIGTNRDNFATGRTNGGTDRVPGDRVEGTVPEDESTR